MNAPISGADRITSLDLSKQTTIELGKFRITAHTIEGEPYDLRGL